MALSKEILINNVKEELYYKIINITEIGDIIKINVGVFRNKDDARNMIDIQGYGEFEFTPNKKEKNLLKQAYEYLKTLSGFEDFNSI